MHGDDQVRDVPDDAHDVIRRRAREAGQSIQAYMLDAIVRLATEPTNDELFAEVDAFVDRHGVQVNRDSMLNELDAIRR